MMDSVPTLLKCYYINDVFITISCDFVLNLSYIMHALCHISLPSDYLYLIAYFSTFDLLVFHCLNGRVCITRLMF